MSNVATLHAPVKAIYRDGRFDLLDSIALPEGSTVTIQVIPPKQKHTISMARLDALPKIPLQPAQLLSASDLDTLVGKFPLGGDALEDSDSL